MIIGSTPLGHCMRHPATTSVVYYWNCFKFNKCGLTGYPFLSSITGAFFWDYSAYSYSGLEIKEYAEFQFPKERSFWKRDDYGGGDLRTTTSAHALTSWAMKSHTLEGDRPFLPGYFDGHKSIYLHSRSSHHFILCFIPFTGWWTQ